MHGAKILAQALEDSEVEYAFGVAGSVVLGTLDEVSQTDVSFVATRHEHTAAAMATGYALATRTPVASISHVGPGAANQIIGVASAFRENVPVVSITGNEPSFRLGKDVRHEWDVLEVFDRFTKHNTRLGADHPYHQVRDALTRSVTGVPGPVHIDVPRDLEEAELPDPGPERARFRAKDHRASRTSARPTADVIDRTVDLLRDAERPVVVAGDEFRWFGGTEELLSFAELLDVPVVNEQNARGAFPETHDLSLGVVGRAGLDPTNEYFSDADLVVGLGSRLGDLTTGNWELLDQDVDLVHVTLRSREIDRHYVSTVDAFADTESFLVDLLDALEGDPDVPVFTDVAADARARYERAHEQYFEPAEDAEGDGVDPGVLVATIDEIAGEYAITTGGGVHTNWPRQLPRKDLRSSYGTPNFSGMSQGFPLAMGAQLALERPVITFEGDGGFAMVMQDLETAVRADIPVKVVVMNNHSFMSQRARQKRYYDGRYTGTEFSNPNYAEVARNFGMFGERVTPETDLEPVVERWLEADGPALLEAEIDPWVGLSGYDRD